MNHAFPGVFFFFSPPYNQGWRVDVDETDILDVLFSYVMQELEGLEVNWGPVYDQEIIIIWMSICSFAKWTESNGEGNLDLSCSGMSYFSSLLFWIKYNGSSRVSERAAELFIIFSLYWFHSLRPFPRIFLLFKKTRTTMTPKRVRFQVSFLLLLLICNWGKVLILSGKFKFSWKLYVKSL